MKVTLTQKATQWLRDCLVGPAWKADKENHAKAARDSYKASQLLYEVIPEPQDVPKTENKEQLEAWADVKLPEWEVDEKNLERIKRCLKFFFKEGAIPGTKHVFELQKTFNVGTDPVEGD